MPSHNPVFASASSALPDPSSAQAITSSTAARPPVSGRPARRSSARSPTSVSQQPSDPQRQRGPGRVDRHVADLAGIPGRADEQLPVDDQAAAHADLAGYVEDVVDAHRRAPPVLGERAEVGIVSDR